MGGRLAGEREGLAEIRERRAGRMAVIRIYTCMKSSKEFFNIFGVEGEGVCDFSETWSGKMAQQLNIWYKCM